MKLPAGALRLFSGYDAGELTLRRYRGFLIGQILEHGDGEDLRWLLSTIRKRHITEFVQQQGPRKLTHRNLAFWCLIADLPNDKAASSGDLWPL